MKIPCPGCGLPVRIYRTIRHGEAVVRYFKCWQCGSIGNVRRCEVFTKLVMHWRRLVPGDPQMA